MPNLYKKELLTRRAIFAAVPGLEVAEALFAANAGQMFCVKNSKLQYVVVNDAFVERSRVAGRAAVLGKTAREIFPPWLAAGYEQQDDVVLNAGRALADKLEMITNADGSVGWYLTQKQPVRDVAGRVVALASVSTDLHAPVADDPRLGKLAGAIERLQARLCRATPHCRTRQRCGHVAQPVRTADARAAALIAKAIADPRPCRSRRPAVARNR
ncbi:MAG: PAS domain-containing protein [Tepidisphaeraceae bacterium]